MWANIWHYFNPDGEVERLLSDLSRILMPGFIETDRVVKEINLHPFTFGPSA